jgi:hypothetical protein
MFSATFLAVAIPSASILPLTPHEDKQLENERVHTCLKIMEREHQKMESWKRSGFNYSNFDFASLFKNSNLQT